MDILGTPTKDWQARLTAVSAQVREAVDRVWPTCVRDITPAELNHEDKITQRLYAELRDDLKLREAPFIVVYQHILIERDANRVPVEIGRIDIAALYDTDPKVYYACEAKRLHVPTTSGRRSGAAAYVRDGVHRYSRGQYSAGVHLASMLGYVLDGDVPGAEVSITKALRRRASVVGCISNPPVVFIAGSGTSLHSRGKGSQIQVDHLLLSL